MKKANKATKVRAVREPAPSAARPRRTRKNMRLDQQLLDEARRALGAADETETVTIALERIVNNRRVANGLRTIAGKLRLDESRIND